MSFHHACLGVTVMPSAGLKQTAAATVTYQVLGLGERVLHVGEAEAGHRDELTHHRHKLVAQLLRPLLLVFQLLSDEKKK